MIADAADEVGKLAAEEFAAAAQAALKSRDEISVVLSTGNSQGSFREAIKARDDIEWSRITVLHVDEYLGVSGDLPASTGWRMNEDFVKHVSPKAFFAIRGDHLPVEEELARYTGLIQELRPSICVMGIGENGHLAFNDPPADFETTEVMQMVTLDDACKRQVVGEGRFPSVEEVPQRALTMTVHALLQPETVLVLVPESRKAAAVKLALEGPISPLCPASILRRNPHARLYLEPDSAELLDLTTQSNFVKD